MSISLIGIGILMGVFLLIGVFIIRYLEKGYNTLALLPFAVFLFLIPAFTSALIVDSQDCQNLVANATDSSNLHTFEYEYTCQEPTSTSTTLHKVSLWVVIFLGSMLLVFWGFNLLSGVGGKES